MNWQGDEVGGMGCCGSIAYNYKQVIDINGIVASGGPLPAFSASLDTQTPLLSPQNSNQRPENRKSGQTSRAISTLNNQFSTR